MLSAYSARCPFFRYSCKTSNNVPVRRLQRVGLSRFRLTRFCYSQVLSIQDLFLVPHVSKELRHQLLPIGAYAPSPALHLSGLSCRLRRLTVFFLGYIEYTKPARQNQSYSQDIGLSSPGIS